MPYRCRTLSLVAAAWTVAIPAAPAQVVQHVFAGDQPDGHFGFAVAGAGDVDADGFGDLIVGAPAIEPDGGGHFVAPPLEVVRVHSGRDGAVLWSYTNLMQEDFGWSVAGAGDVDADGHADFVVGSRRDDTNALDAGRVQVFSGLTGQELYRFLGDAILDELGWSVAGAGDVDNDGYDDVIAAARSYSTGTQGTYARVYSGRNGSLLHEFLDPAGNRTTIGVAGVGDVDLDGHDDVALSLCNAIYPFPATAS